MGFYLRTSLRAGPFRFTMSRSGVGVSAGVPGFRVGTGPRGNYVRVGGRGSYYSVTSGRTAVSPARRQLDSAPPLSPMDSVAFESLDGASVQELAATNPTGIISELQTAAKRTRLWPIATILLVVIAVFTIPVGPLLLLPGIPAILWLRQRDQARRSVVVFYQVDDQPAARFDRLATIHAALCQTQRSWNVEARADLVTPYQRKVNAGASALNRRHSAKLAIGGPPPLVTNIVVPTLTSKSRSVYFLPDRVLIREKRTYAELDYPTLNAQMSPTRFIEGEAVPSDSQQVGTTWKYANAKGGPDRRFKNNCQLPIMLYGRLTLTNPRGFHMVWDFSRPDIAAIFAEALRAMN